MKELVGSYVDRAGYHTPKAGERYSRLDANFPESRLGYLKHLVKLALTAPGEYARDARLIFQDLILARSEREQFITSPEFSGQSIPHGNGGVDVIVPGFAAGGWAYSETKTCLKEARHHPIDYPVNFGSNTEPVEQAVYKFVRFITKKKKENGKKLTLTGHSKGGLLIYAAWLKYPKEVENSTKQVFLIGAPIPEWVNSIVAGAYLATQFFYRADDFRFMQRLTMEFKINGELRMPEKIPMTTIDSGNDRVIRGRYISRPEDHFEVPGASHAGLLWNRKVMRIKLARMAGWRVVS